MKGFENLGLFLEKGLIGGRELAAVRDNPNKILENLERVLKRYRVPEAELRCLVNEVKEAAKARYGRVLSLRARVETPLLIGLGSPSPYEAHLHTSLPHGHPVIEPSSIKGVAKFCAETFKGDLGLTEKDIKVIFGEREGMGQVVWLPGLPVYYRVGRTIINIHYPKYYEEDEGVEFKEWEDPRLVHLPCVLPGGEFWFGIAGSEDEIVRRTGEILGRALGDLGIGGKTRVGFGKFKVMAEEME